MEDEKLNQGQGNPADVSSTSETESQETEDALLAEGAKEEGGDIQNDEEFTQQGEGGEVEEKKVKAVPYDRFKEVIEEKNRLKQEAEEARRLLLQQQQQKLQQQPEEDKPPELSEYPTAEEIKAYEDWRERQLIKKYQQDLIARETAREQIERFKQENPDLAKHIKLVGIFLNEVTVERPDLLPSQRIEEAKKRAREYIASIKNEAKSEVKKELTKTSNATVVSGSSNVSTPKKEEDKPLTREEYMKLRGIEE